MLLSAVSKASFLNSFSLPTLSKKQSKLPLLDLEFNSFTKRSSYALSTNWDVISVLKPSQANKHSSHSPSLLQRLQNPTKGSITQKEVEDFLDEIAQGRFQQKASLKELRQALHLLIRYAKEGTEDPLDLPHLEKDTHELLELEKGFDFVGSSFSPSKIKAHEFLCSKKKSWFQKVCKKVGNFVKKHRKAIVLGICIAAAVVVVAVATVAVINTVGTAALAEGAAASAAAAAGVMGNGASISGNEAEKKIEPNSINAEASVQIAEGAQLDSTPLAFKEEQFFSAQYYENKLQTSDKDLKWDAIGLETYSETSAAHFALGNYDQALKDLQQAEYFDKLQPSAPIHDYLPSHAVAEVIHQPPSKLKDFPNFEKALLRIPLEYDSDGFPYAEPQSFYKPSQIISYGGKKSPYGDSIFVNGMLTLYEEAFEVVKFMSEMQGGNQVHLNYNSTLGLERDLIKQKYIKGNYLIPTAKLLKEQVMNYFQTADKTKVLYLSVHSQGGAILKMILPEIPQEYRDRMLVDSYGTAAYISKEMVEMVRNFWHPNDKISKMADPKGWELAREEGTLITLENDGKSTFNSHGLMRGYLQPFKDNNIDFAQGNLKW